MVVGFISECKFLHHVVIVLRILIFALSIIDITVVIVLDITIIVFVFFFSFLFPLLLCVLFFIMISYPCMPYASYLFTYLINVVHSASSHAILIVKDTLLMPFDP